MAMRRVKDVSPWHGTVLVSVEKEAMEQGCTLRQRHQLRLACSSTTPPAGEAIQVVLWVSQQEEMEETVQNAGAQMVPSPTARFGGTHSGRAGQAAPTHQVRREPAVGSGAQTGGLLTASCGTTTGMKSRVAVLKWPTRMSNRERTGRGLMRQRALIRKIGRA